MSSHSNANNIDELLSLLEYRALISMAPIRSCLETIYGVQGVQLSTAIDVFRANIDAHKEYVRSRFIKEGMSDELCHHCGFNAEIGLMTFEENTKRIIMTWKRGIK
jgi:hypothetical protein